MRRRPICLVKGTEMIGFLVLVTASLPLAPILTGTSEPLIEVLVNCIILASGIGLLEAMSGYNAQEEKDAEAAEGE